MRALLEVVPSVTAELYPPLSSPCLVKIQTIGSVTQSQAHGGLLYLGTALLGNSLPHRALRGLHHSSFGLRSLHTKSAYMPNRRAFQGPLNPQTWPFQHTFWWLYRSIFARTSATTTFPGSVHGGVPLSFSPSLEM